MPKKVVYNHKPDPVTKITEFEIDKPKPKKNAYDEQLKSDPLFLEEQRMLLNEQMEDN